MAKQWIKEQKLSIIEFILAQDKNDSKQWEYVTLLMSLLLMLKQRQEKSEK